MACKYFDSLYSLTPTYLDYRAIRGKSFSCISLLILLVGRPNLEAWLESNIYIFKLN